MQYMGRPVETIPISTGLPDSATITSRRQQLQAPGLSGCRDLNNRPA